MSGVFQNIDPPPPGEFVPPRLWCVGRPHSLGEEGGGGGSILWKTPDTALYSTYVSTLWSTALKGMFSLAEVCRISCRVSSREKGRGAR